jgi:hypothetical protein
VKATVTITTSGAVALVVVTGCSLGLPGKADPPADAGVPTTVTSGDGAASDGAPLACPPDPTGFAPTPWKPLAGARRNLCNETQSNQLAECIGNLSSSATACDAFKSANATCYQCAVTSSIAASYSAIIDDGNFFYPNIPGCISAATGDLGPTSCGAKWQANNECAEHSCTRCSDADFGACFDEAADGICHRSYDASCSDAVWEQCASSAGNLKEGLLKTIRVFCGGT